MSYSYIDFGSISDKEIQTGIVYPKAILYSIAF